MTVRSFKPTYTISNELNDSETFYSDTTGVYVWGASTNGGATTFGGSPGRIPDLNNVTQIYATDLAFAALLSDGSVYMWGDPSVIGTEGFLTLNGDKITSVKTIRTTPYAFAAILTNGQVIVWGRNTLGGDPYYQTGDPLQFSPPVLVSELSNIKAIYSTNQSFSALDESGDVWAWGFLSNQIFSIYKVSFATNVKTITGNYSAFAALRNDGTVCVWGVANSGGEIGLGQGPGIIPGLSNVKKIYATESAFAALRNDSTVFIWGNVSNGGSLDNTNGTSYQNIPATGITDICSNTGAFVGITNTEGVYIWGNPGMGGSQVYNPGVYSPAYIYGITNVCVSSQAFAGVTNNDSVYVWGNPGKGGSNIYNNSSGYGLIDLIDKVSSITASGGSFSAILPDGKVVRWGDPTAGGGTTGNPELVPEVSNATDVFANNASFLSVSPNQSYFAWGFSLGGGDNSQISTLTNFVKLAKGNLGTYAALEKPVPPPIPPTPVEEKSALSSTNASIFGIVMAIILFVSFYLISNFIEDNTTRIVLMLIALSFIITGIVLVILFV